MTVDPEVSSTECRVEIKVSNENATVEDDVWVYGKEGLKVTCSSDCVNEATSHWFSWNKATTSWQPVQNDKSTLLSIDYNAGNPTLTFASLLDSTERRAKALSTQYICMVWRNTNNSVYFSGQITTRYPCEYYGYCSIGQKYSLWL